MFHTFSTRGANPPRAHRSSNSAASPFRACDRCRLYRVKCGEKPCAQCAAHSVRCVTSPIGRQRSSPPPRAVTPLSSLPQSYGFAPQPTPAPAPERTRPPGTGSSPSSGCSSSSGSSSSSSTTTSYSSSSSFSSSSSISSSAAPAAAELGKAPPALTRAQQASVLRLYWKTFHQIMPLLGRAAFEALQRQDAADLRAREPASGALVDAMTALGLFCAGRMLGLGPNEQRDAAWAFFARCCEAMRQGFAATTLEALQAHVVMAVFLLQAGDCNAVYHMLGIAIRKAHTFGLHRDPGPDVPPAERSARARLWWLLSSLDVACALQLGTPPAVHRAVVTCPLPDLADDCASASWTGVPASACQAYIARLVVALQDTGACELAVELLDENNSAAAVEACAGRLQRALERLQQWRAELPPALCMPSLDDISPAFDLDMPAWVGHQRIILDLAYHCVHVLLLRAFISHAASASAFPTSIAQHVEGAPGHAVHVIRTVHAICSNSDLLYGCTAAVHALWMAAVTLGAAVTSKALSADASEAYACLSQALQIFEWLRTGCPLAAQAQSAVQALADRVHDALGGPAITAGAVLPVLPDELPSLWDPAQLVGGNGSLLSSPSLASPIANLDLSLPALCDLSTWPLYEPELQ